MKSRRYNYQRFFIYAALICMGFVIGLFLTYGFVVMPGLATIDDVSFVTAFQGLETRFQSIGNQSVLKSAVSYGNIPAFIAFPGSILFTLVALVLSWKENYRLWIIAALIVFGIGVLTTLLYNLPSNEVIFKAGDPQLIDASAVRNTFNEASWAAWNHFRTVTTAIAFCCLLRALFLLKSKSQ